jgi:acylaminoacyl-peptidase
MKISVRLLAAASLTLLFGGIADARPFTARDMVTLDRVSDPQVSPNGRWVLYDLRVVDYDANKSRHELWIVDLKDKTPSPQRLAASDGGATGGRWGRDSNTIYFLSSRSGESQVWRTDRDGKAATQVTQMPFDIDAFQVSPDGKTLVVDQAVFPDCPDLACTQSRLEAKKDVKTTGVLYDRLFVRHWDTWADGTRNHLFALNLDGGVASNPVDITRGFDGDVPGKPFGDDGDFVFTPDSRGVIFSARLAGKTEAWSTNFDLWQVSLAGGAPVNLTSANEAEDIGPVFSPDGKQMAYRAMKRPTFEADRLGIWVRDMATGDSREIAAGWDRSADSLAWSEDGKTLYVTAQDVGQTRLFAIDVATGAVKPLTGDGHVGSVQVADKGLVISRDALDSPAQLYRIGFDGKDETPLTHANLDVTSKIDWGQYEQFSFTGWNGDKVYGYLVKPANFDPSKKYPIAFLIHGGPQGSFGNLFHYRWNAQTYAGAGYAVVMIDFHGSTGYGQAFTDAISQHWGDRPLEDLQKGWAAALARYSFLDGDRACALGGSYGGYMINWMAGVWNQPWKCFVNHDGIFDTRFMGASTEELWFSEWENGGTLWSNPDGYEKFNPAAKVGNWSKPMLVVEGGRDYRVPLEEALSTFGTLQRKGIESQFLYFPDENHWVLKPQNSVQWHDTVLDWLARWTGPDAPKS